MAQPTRPYGSWLLAYARDGVSIWALSAETKKGPIEMKRSLREAGSFVVDSIRNLLGDLHPQSRLMEMYRVIAAGGVVEPNDPGFETVCEAVRDILLFEFVFDHVNNHPGSNKFADRVSTAIKDSVFAQRDRGQSKGRDAQFELYIAAVCEAGGLTPVEFDEPDVTCHVEGVKYGVAAKRFKSVGKLETRLRKAADQIWRTGLPGVIALDLCMALNPDNARMILQIPDEKFADHHSEALKQFVGQRHNKIQECVRGKGVRCVVIHDHVILQDVSREWSLAGFTFWIPVIGQSEREEIEYRMFHDAYCRGLQDLKHIGRGVA